MKQMLLSIIGIVALVMVMSQQLSSRPPNRQTALIKALIQKERR
jgi:hypothetical protein